MADVTFAFPLTQDEAIVPNYFTLRTGQSSVTVVTAAPNVALKVTEIATDLHLLDLEELVAPVVPISTEGLTLLNHGKLTDAQVAQACYVYAAAAGLVKDEHAYGTRSAGAGAIGTDQGVPLQPTALEPGTWTPTPE